MERVIDDHVRDRNKLIEETKGLIRENKGFIDQSNKFIEQVKKDNENRAKNMNANIKINSDKIKELNTFKDDTKAFEESFIQYFMS